MYVPRNFFSILERMIEVVVICTAVLTFVNAGTSVWEKNEDCHLCGMKKEVSSVNDPIEASIRVINGKDVESSENKHPWVVAIYRKKNFLCTGCLITKRFILTASHCIIEGATSDTDPMDPGDLTVVLQDSEQHLTVSRVLIHPDFLLTKNEFQHDIGLLKLEDRFRCSRDAYPICVPDEDMQRIGKKMRIAGYGHHKNEDRRKKIFDPKLRNGSEIQVKSKECKKAGPNTGPSESIICGISSATKAVACEGDSGGPAFWKFESVYYVPGIISSISGSGECTSDAKTTFSKVYYYKDWLKKKVGKLPKPHRK